MCHIVMWLQMEQLFRIDGFFQGHMQLEYSPNNINFQKIYNTVYAMCSLLKKIHWLESRFKWIESKLISIEILSYQ